MSTTPPTGFDRQEPLLAYGKSKRPRRNYKRLLPFAIVLLAIVAMVPFALKAMEPRVGRHASRQTAPIEGLPAAATDICYAMDGAFGPSSAYEFTISKNDFIAWAKDQGWAIQRITAPKTVHQYGDASTDPNDPQETEITSGYFFEWVDPQASDNRLTVGYDEDRRRAYWYRSYR